MGTSPFVVQSVGVPTSGPSRLTMLHGACQGHRTAGRRLCTAHVPARTPGLVECDLWNIVRKGHWQPARETLLCSEEAVAVQYRAGSRPADDRRAGHVHPDWVVAGRTP